MFAWARRLSLVLVGLSLPMQGYSFLDFRFGMTPFKLATAILLSIALVQYGISGGSRVRDRKTWWMLAFLVSYLISSVAGFLGGIELYAILIASSTTISLVLYYFLIGYVVNSRRDLVLVLWALLAGGALTAAPAVLGVQHGTDIGYGERYTGLSGQANLLGFDMAVCFPIGIAFFFGASSRVRRGLALGLAFACVIGLLMSLSRAAFVSLGAMSVFWFARSGRADSIKYAVPVLALTVGLAVVAPESVVQRMESMINPARRAEDGSIQNRMQQLPFAFHAIASNPVVGLGVLRFIPWVNEQPGGLGFRNEVHNAYLGVAVEQGLLGLIPYLAILGLSWGDYSRCLRELRARARARDPALLELQHHVAFLQIALLGTLIGGLFGLAHRSKTAWLLFALSPVVLALARARIQELVPGSEERVQPVYFGAPHLSPSAAVTTPGHFGSSRTS